MEKYTRILIVKSTKFGLITVIGHIQQVQYFVKRNFYFINKDDHKQHFNDECQILIR